MPVLGSQPAGDVSHKPGGRLTLLSARHAVTPATLKRAATNFATWWTEARWVWTVCLRLLPDSGRLQFEPGPFCAWVQYTNHSATEPPVHCFTVSIFVPGGSLTLVCFSPCLSACQVARPRNVETTGARVSFRPRNIFPHFCMLFLKLPLFVVILPTYN